eukprot:1253054-Prymnesium_polylepis.3
MLCARQRQMMLDRIAWDDVAGWPKSMTPSRTRRFPAGARSSGARWRPVLTDEFDGSELEGVTAGPLGRKWLFKQENESLWSLSRRPGRLSLNVSCAGVESSAPDNLLLQRPTASYYTLESARAGPRTIRPPLSCPPTPLRVAFGA